MAPDVPGTQIATTNVQLKLVLFADERINSPLALAQTIKVAGK